MPKKLWYDRTFEKSWRKNRVSPDSCNFCDFQRCFCSRKAKSLAQQRSCITHSASAKHLLILDCTVFWHWVDLVKRRSGSKKHGSILELLCLSSRDSSVPCGRCQPLERRSPSFADKKDGRRSRSLTQTDSADSNLTLKPYTLLRFCSEYKDNQTVCCIHVT